MSGWIKMHRSMMNHWCSSDPNFLAVWLRLLFDANYEDKKSLINGTVVNIKRGQVLFGLPSFSKRSGVTVSKLRRIISVLSEEGMIDRQTTNKYSIISITKYEQYQADDRQKTNKTHSKRKQNATSKEDNNLTKKEIDILFDRFCKAYPSRGSAANPMGPCREKFERIIKTVDPEILINAASQYALDENAGTKFIAQTQTWLNQGRWNDCEFIDQNVKDWETKLEQYKKGKWTESWGSKPCINGWQQADHGECPESIAIQFLEVSRASSNGSASEC